MKSWSFNPNASGRSAGNFRNRGLNVRSVGVESIGLALLIGAGFLSEPAYAGDGVTKCSLATLKGQYLVAGGGTLFPPAFGVSEEAVSGVAGYSIYNGDGTGADYVTFTINGVNAKVASPIPTTYTLKPDCTGTRTVLNGPHFDIYVAFDGSGLTEIATDTGFAVSTFDKRTRPQEER